MIDFTHLHLHTQYSILDGATKISSLFERAKEFNMKAVAITDHGNMFGVMDFIIEAKKYDIKPIIGCEVYVAANGRFSRSLKDDRSGYHLILLAKNKEGYHNLSKIVSLAYIEGYYYTPRVDKELLMTYREGIIALSACLGGEIPSAILGRGEEYAKQVIKEYKDIFGDDFYLEVMRHGLHEQDSVNEVIVRLSKELNIPIVATNDVHFVMDEDFEAHKILICLNTKRELNEDTNLYYTGNEYFKSPEEMAELFSDIPEAISNTMAIADKIESFDLQHKIILPVFPLPEPFTDEHEYLTHITYEGAKRRYPELTNEIKERLEMELGVIKNMGFAGYFLIVQDFINYARQSGILVGPGRGSAAGSAIAYCTGITNIDPISFNLLFERFLNPERISMPDIDIDFDDQGRDDVIRYVIEKYGSEKVAQIVTFGTMAAKSSIKDVARVLKLPLPEAERLSKLVPETANMTLAKAFNEVPELRHARDKGSELVKKTLKFAPILEGSARQTGIHACGVIIGPDDLIEHVPLCLSKESLLPDKEVMRATQYEGTRVEYVGLLKMDFLGLRTLSVVKEALRNIKQRQNIDIILDDIPLDDKKTLEIFQKGETVGVFQFESEGMRTYLRELKPECLEDVIAMNALYRPGPMEFIPAYIDRKMGRKPVEYPHELVKELLTPTYGVMVYQEQIMLAARILGGFTLSKADNLRKAMGKKDPKEMAEMETHFVKGAMEKGIPKEKATEIFENMQEFAKYGFNRSHSAAYSYLAFQTAYLKAYYPHEYMAAILTCHLGDIKKITLFIEECQRMGIPVLGPDINESELKFVVNSKNEIRFGMAAIKGVGEAAVEEIIDERKKNGNFTGIFDFAKRISLRSVNKKCVEALAYAGAFESFPGTHRAQYFFQAKGEDVIFLEKIMRHAANFQARINSSQQSLFGDVEQADIEDPPMPECEKWSFLEQLKKEKEVIGFYISGHPLDEYAVEVKNFCSVTIEKLKENIPNYINRDFSFAGIVSASQEKTAKNGNRYGTFTVEDHTDNLQITLWMEDFLKWKHLIEPGTFVYIKGKVQVRKFNEDERHEIKLSSIILLSEVIDKYAHNVTVRLSLSDVSEEKINLIYKLVKGNKGKCNLRFQVVDKSSGLSVDLTSERYLVNSDFVKSLKNILQMDYCLN